MDDGYFMYVTFAHNFYESRTRFFYQVYGHFGLLMANTFWILGCGVSLFRTLLSSAFKPNALAYQWRDIWVDFCNH